jgi:hypothetical protein
MSNTITMLALSFAIGIQAPPPQTPAQIADQLSTLVKQLQALLAPAAPTLETAAQVDAACTNGGIYTVAPGTYTVRCVVRKPLTLTGSRDVILKPADVFEPTILVMASDVTIKGITVLDGLPDRETIVVGSAYATDAALQPSRVTLEALKVDAGSDGGHRAIALHGAHLTVTKCEILNYKETGRDSQGVWGNNGPGPYVITDNVIEASGENILFGGADPRIPNLVPADILIARNTLRKPASFAGATNKNAIELKNARRAVITENTIVNELPTLIHDALIQLTPRNQDGTAPWSTLEDIEVTRNTIQTAAPGFAVNILGTDNERPSQQAKRIRIAGNLFLTTQGYQVLGGVAESLVFDHNSTPVITRKLFSFSGAGGSNVMTPLTFTNNVAKAGLYAITGDGDPTTPFGLAVLLKFATVVEWTGNVIERSESHTWPAGQVTLEPGALASLLDPTTYKLRIGTAGY